MDSNSLLRRLSSSSPIEAKRLMDLLNYVESSPNKREIIDFSSQADADKAGHQIRRLGGDRVKVNITASRIVVSMA